MSSSSSAMKKLCFHCGSPSEFLYNGWPRRNGGFAMLCNRCGAAYVTGKFCDTFHPEASGWRNCDSCEKRVHCGCIMATHTHLILDLGGVKCSQCAIYEGLVPYRAPSFENPEPVQQAVGSLGRLSIDSQKVKTGTNSNVNPTPQPGSVVSNDSPCKIATQTIPGAACQGQPSLRQKEKSADIPSKNPPKREIDPLKKKVIQSKYLPTTSPEEIEEICKIQNSTLTPLFEKALTASDADPKNGRFVLPKRCAEAFFPKFSELQGIFMAIQDTKGNNWELYYRYWSNNNGNMYVLEGLKDYVTETQCQPGDKIIFFKREKDGQLVMGLKKVQASISDQKSSTTMLENNNILQRPV